MTATLPPARVRAALNFVAWTAFRMLMVAATVGLTYHVAPLAAGASPGATTLSIRVYWLL